MQPLDPEAESLLREWIEKADADLEVARRMAAEAADNLRIREIVGVPTFGQLRYTPEGPECERCTRPWSWRKSRCIWRLSYDVRPNSERYAVLGSTSRLTALPS